MIQFTVLGTPAPKGSGRAINNPNTGRAMHVPSGSNKNRDAMKSWNGEVRAAAREAIGRVDQLVDAPPFVLVPIALTITFRLRRPADHWSKKGGLKPWAVHALPMSKPDGDKLQRCTLDALKGCVYDDDSRICRYVVEKVYAAPGEEGATIRVEEITSLGGHDDVRIEQRERTAAAEDLFARGARAGDQ